MKKVMIGILVLIPIIVLIVVALVSVIVSVNAHIAVEDLVLLAKESENPIYDLQVSFDDTGTLNLGDYVDVKIYPEKATNKTVEWQIVGEVEYTDEKYEGIRNEYLSNLSKLKSELESELASGSFSSQERKNAYDIARGKYLKDTSLIIAEMADILLEKVYPAAAFVDEKGREVESNTTGKMMLGSYCRFTVRAQAETMSRILTVTVLGYDVERVVLSVPSNEDSVLGVGESMRLLAAYTPIDSIVNKSVWTSSDESVIAVDNNGVVTAKRQGAARVCLKASVYSSEKKSALEYVEGYIDLTVEQKGASSIFGDRLVTSKSSVTTSEIGVVQDDIESVEGGVVNSDGTLSLDADIVKITTRDGRKLEIVKCAEGDVTFRNSKFYDKKSGYVLAVGENVLDLDLVWTDMLKSDAFDSEQWTSSNESIATVDGKGEVRGISSGYVTITATVAQKSVSITLNVQNKLSQIHLRTSDASLAIGIARETVFANQRYKDVSVDNQKVASYTLIRVQGEPQGANAEQLAAFYDLYDFEIVKGGEFASFDSVVRNKIVFGNAIEGKGKQQIVVQVSAKYPKYEGMTRFTTEQVTLNLVYGVEASSFKELQQAALDQLAYVEKEGNLQEDVEIFRNELDKEAYVVNKIGGGKNKFAICLFDNCKYDFESGQIVNWLNCLKFASDVYGNNKRISAETSNLDSDSYLIQIVRPNVVLSNLIVRGNEIDDQYEITDAEDTSSFAGNILRVGDEWKHFENVRIEYCIIENGKKGINVFSTDLTVDGCIIRNITNAAMYVPTRMSQTNGEIDQKSGKQLVVPCYSHLTLNNVICSNTLGSLASVAYEHYTLKKNSKFRFVEGSKKTDEDGSLANANEDYFFANFQSKGINTSVTQTGFLWAYNWQDVDNAKLIQTSNDLVNHMLSVYFKPIVQSSKTFDDFRYVDKKAGKEYLHLAFMVTGIDFAYDIMSAPTYLDLSLQEQMHSVDVSKVNLDGVGIPNGVKKLIGDMSIKFYGYDNKAAINPNTPPYQVNSALIDKIHS